MFDLIFDDLPPTPKARPRFTKSGRVYSCQNTARYERALHNAALLYMAETGTPQFAAKAALAVDVEFYLPKPASMSDKAFAQSNHKVTKPDIDNYIKAALDALNGTIYADDNQVTDIHAIKRLTTDKPYIRIQVTLATKQGA